MQSVRDLYSRLAEDTFRRDSPFSNEIDEANGVLFHPFASNVDREKVLNLWFQQHQPCLFGRVAAAQNKIHYCVITDEDLQRPDEEIAEQIREELVAWKRRSIRPAPEISLPAHGFMLAVISPRVCFAEPNDTLRLLAQRLIELWGCSQTSESHGSVFWESLLLEKPDVGEIYRFSVSIDFFSSQGDQRWWHDHRVPGGLAFTANSAGHMGRYREWYEGKTRQQEWLLATAMGTIDLASDTPYGRATWLRDLPSDGRPLVTNIPCPFTRTDRMGAALTGKDWTRYAGHYHTDQAVRPEFFSREAEKSATVRANEWLLDFTYLYDSRLRDHRRFIAGELMSLEEVVSEIGESDEWVRIVSPTRRRRIRAVGSSEHREEIERLLASCERWGLPLEVVRDLVH